MSNNQPQIDETDHAILGLLETDARMSNAGLAREVGLSPSACLGRVKRLQEQGVVKQFTAIADEQKLGLGVAAFTFISLDKHSRAAADAFVQRIRQTPQVMECYNITGRADYLLKIYSPDISAYRDFVIDTLLEIPGVSRAETLVVLKTEKREFSLPIEPRTK